LSALATGVFSLFLITANSTGKGISGDPTLQLGKNWWWPKAYDIRDLTLL